MTPVESISATGVPLYLNTRFEPSCCITQFAAETLPAEPVVFWFNVGKVQFAKLPDAGVPSAGDTSVGLFESTTLPEPVDVVTPVPPRATDRVPVVPATIGKPVAFVSVAEEGVPNAGVTNVGLVANTNAPDPVSSVTAAAKFEDDGVAKNVATPAPRPETPVEIGNPVAFVNVPDDGVPRAPPLTTGAPAVPTLTASTVATPVPRPETPVEIGSPVALVKVPDDGVPRAGVTNVGDVKVPVLTVGFVSVGVARVGEIK